MMKTYEKKKKLWKTLLTDFVPQRLELLLATQIPEH